MTASPRCARSPLAVAVRGEHPCGHRLTRLCSSLEVVDNIAGQTRHKAEFRAGKSTDEFMACPDGPGPDHPAGDGGALFAAEPQSGVSLVLRKKPQQILRRKGSAGPGNDVNPVGELHAVPVKDSCKGPSAAMRTLSGRQSMWPMTMGPGADWASERPNSAIPRIHSESATSTVRSASGRGRFRQMTVSSHESDLPLPLGGLEAELVAFRVPHDAAVVRPLSHGVAVLLRPQHPCAEICEPLTLA